MVPRFFVVLLVAVCTVGHAACVEPGLRAEAAVLPAPGADGFITLFNLNFPLVGSITH